MNWKHKYVRVEKVEPLKDQPAFPTPNAEQYKYGEENPGVSIPTGYWITGEMMVEVEVGRSLMVMRDCRNGVAGFGEFITSPVQAVDDRDGKLVIATSNSVYLVQEVEDKRTENQKIIGALLN